MLDRKYIIEDGKVVCDLCHANCGQCGEGVWMGRCQEYLDNNPSVVTNLTVFERTVIVVSGGVIVVALTWLFFITDFSSWLK